MLNTVLTVAVLGFFGGRLVRAARFATQGYGRSRVRAIVGGIRVRHVAPVPVVLALVLVSALILLQVPGLDFGWWTALGGQGNPVTGATDQTAGTVLEWLIPLVFLTLLLPALPLFAQREEEIFRAGAETWSGWKRIGMAIWFGLVHAIIGIPIGVALALSIGGGYFQLVYLRAFARTHQRADAVMDSTRAHTAYNGVIIVLVLIAIVLTAFSVA